MCEENAENIKRNLPVVVLQKDVTFRRRIKEKKVDHLFNKKICIHCGKEFSAKRGDAKTCGTRCRVAAARAKHKPDSRKPFSIKEIMLLQQIGQLVLNNLEFEKEADEYRANYENWMCNLSKDDYKTLKIAVKK